MMRGGIVRNLRLGPLRLRAHVRMWPPMLYVSWGVRGGRVHGLFLGNY